MLLAEKVGFDGKSTHYEVFPSHLGVRRNNVVLIEIAGQRYSLKKRGEKEGRGVSLTAPKYVGALIARSHRLLPIQY